MSGLSELEQAMLAIEARKDSIEIGKPSGLGKLKIYVDASDLEGAKGLVDNAIKVLSHAKSKYEALETGEE